MDDLSDLATRTWDGVIDTCGYVPRVVRQSASALRDSTGRYLFVSSINAYNVVEEGEPTLIDREPLDTEEIDGETYGPLKVECEKAIAEIFGSRALIVRPGLVAGPHDPTNRFTYWVERFANGGPVLVPDLKDQDLQLVDARDLGEFMVTGLEKGLSGAFDVAGELGTFGGMIRALCTVWPGADPVMASPGQLEELEVELWTDLPCAMADAKVTRSMMRFKCLPAVEEGLTRRPLEETARDTHEWAAAHAAADPPYGMSRERELEVLGRLGG